MKQITCSLLIMILILTYPMVSRAQQIQYIKLEGAQFKDYNGNDFYPVCANYVLSLVYDTFGESYTFAPFINYGGNQDFEHPWDAFATLDDMEQDFNNMVTMGFNTVHLVGAAPATRDDPAAGLPYGLKFFTYPNWQWVNAAHHMMVSPCTNDTEIPKIFAALDQVLIRAANVGLKVIIDGQTDDKFVSSQIADTDYNCYLQLLAQHFSNNTTLMAYILTGEASNNDYITPHTKGEICELVSSWYQSIRDHDPNHLIGCGFFNFEEIKQWDPGVMKMDFLFPHLYLVYHDYEDAGFTYHNFNDAMDRYKAMCYWLQENSPYPWMVAETGFNCENPAANPKNPGYEGDWNDQQIFIQEALQAIYLHGGSGVAIWSYQDGYNCNGSPPLQVCDFYGMLKREDQYDPASFPDIYKPAVVEIQDYFNSYPAQVNLVPQPPPANYDDICHSVHYSQTANTIDVNGTVTDQDGKPVKDAVLKAYTYDKHENGHPVSHVYYTFTDENGEFTFTPFDPAHPNDQTRQYIYFMEVSATGCNNDMKNSWSFDPDDYAPTKLPPPVPNPCNFILNRISTITHQHIQNTTVYNSDVKYYQGYKTLLINNNVAVEPGGTADFKAKYIVTVGDEFHADYGSEVHIYNDQVYADCDEMNGSPFYFRHEGYGDGTKAQSQKGLDLIFVKKIVPESVSIYPNPTTDQLNLHYSGRQKARKKVEVLDFLGKEILQFQFEENDISINISHLPKGIYSMKLTTPSGVFNKKIILQ